MYLHPKHEREMSEFMQIAIHIIGIAINNAYSSYSYIQEAKDKLGKKEEEGGGEEASTCNPDPEKESENAEKPVVKWKFFAHNKCFIDETPFLSLSLFLHSDKFYLNISNIQS